MRQLELAQLGWQSILAIATISMLLQQAFSYVCQMVLPILADRLAEEFGIARAWLGLYLFIQNLMAIVAAVGCGGFILRYGPLRVSQIALGMMGASLLVVASGWLALYPLAAVLLGAASVSTPASSHILARVCPPRLAPVIFSVKQTGVPVGALIGGLLVPFLLGLVFYSASLGTTVRFGAFSTALVTALVVLLVAASLQPIRAYFDRDRRPDVKISVSDLPDTLRLVLGNHPLRDISFAAFAFGGLQSLFSGFFILYLIDGLGYSETVAGSAFALASFSAIWARIGWGALGSSLVPPRWILGGIGLLGGISALGMAQFDVGWSIYGITAVAVLFNVSALSWHGLLLAETARLAPPDRVGGVTGGVLSFTSVAMMIYPALYGIILASTGSYRLGFVLGAIPSFIAFAIFIGPPVPRPWMEAAAGVARGLLSPRRLAETGAIITLGAALGILASLGG